ncbi:RNA binding motif protein 12Ba [Nematolebias whitei]|uniref:RNA binding motif protein 12Ba n=1 Tax=Nematolebias whitei TaxID=451745 RepID=UPI0018984CF9|nr:RNA binding motif protein 12Ba [Nematolebias whitei]
MTVILRLQGLDEKADADDIRSFFKSLHIPKGGIYIVGGSLREAFIAFNTEREAQLAMIQTGEAIKGSKVILKKSSMAQLEHRLETLIKTKKSRHTVLKPQPQSDSNSTSSHHEDNTAIPSAARSPNLDTANLPHTNNQESCASTSNVPASNENPIDSGTAFLLGICTVLKGLQSSQTTIPGVDFNANKRTLPEEVETPEETKPGYVRLFGLPESTTKEDICQFFKGLTVQEAIVNVRLGPSRGCLVMFTKMRDAFDALHFNKRLLGSICVEVRGADEKMWLSALEECKNALEVLVRNDPRQRIKESANKDSVLQLKRKTAKPFPLKPSKRHKNDALSNTWIPQSKEYIVMVSNLPCTMTKTEIKELFQCPNLSHTNVLHLLDQSSSRTDKAFLMFNSVEDFDYAMNLSGCHVGSDTIEVSSITRKDMTKMLSKDRTKVSKVWSDRSKNV